MYFFLFFFLYCIVVGEIITDSSSETNPDVEPRSFVLSCYCVFPLNADIYIYISIRNQQQKQHYGQGLLDNGLKDNFMVIFASNTYKK